MDQGRRSRGGRGEDEQGRFDYGKVGGREGGFGGKREGRLGENAMQCNCARLLGRG